MHFCVLTARVYARFSRPRKIGLNWFIPALVNKKRRIIVWHDRTARHKRVAVLLDENRCRLGESRLMSWLFHNQKSGHYA